MKNLGVSVSRKQRKTRNNKTWKSGNSFCPNHFLFFFWEVTMAVNSQVSELLAQFLRAEMEEI